VVERCNLGDVYRIRDSFVYFMEHKNTYGAVMVHCIDLQEKPEAWDKLPAFDDIIVCF
jgi:hypothetical protein